VWNTPVRIIPTEERAAVRVSPFWMSDAVPTPWLDPPIATPRAT
jgi:hypothetical protein